MVLTCFGWRLLKGLGTPASRAVMQQLADMGAGHLVRVRAPPAVGSTRALRSGGRGGAARGGGRRTARREKRPSE